MHQSLLGQGEWLCLEARSFFMKSCSEAMKYPF